ncbi:MAG TPA: hypothetical protein PKN04_00945 [bacterium]|jgi:hypothetical protein|nr:hypothetical protein [bacterium]HNT64326.1 hypothetical protein [bacterium]HPG44475.1 hypothetical protein [bacterium]HPM97033.1 hypothetical protein [bacterium]
MMKRFILLLLAMLFCGAFAVYAQQGLFAIHAGYYGPKDTKGGLSVGGILGKAIDEAVDIGIGFDIFHKSYSDRSLVSRIDQTGLSGEIEETEVDYTRTIIPLHLLAQMKIPSGRYFGYLLRGGVGYQFLISQEKNYELDTSATHTYGGLGWHGAAGVYYYIGSRSTFIADLFYNSSEVSRDIEESQRGLPVTERVNLSGMGFQVGVVIDIK